MPVGVRDVGEAGAGWVLALLDELVPVDSTSWTAPSRSVLSASRKPMCSTPLEPVGAQSGWWFSVIES
jgi:hypothetical protein